MKKSLLFLVSLSGCFLFLQGSGEANIYKYVDRKGIVHFTDRYESIPREYRGKIIIIQEKKKEEAVPAQTPPVMGDKKKEEPSLHVSVANVPARPSSSEQQDTKISPEEQQKLQQQQDKERRIEEVRKQIASRQEEVAKLPTNWMIRDRNNLNRLNQEIAILERTLQSIEEEQGTPQ